ncbi:MULTISPECIES: choice-of-anchor C family PEP-CTERM protein [unclassified Duganella]|uniref:choice-of-anchor C family PEP-CTERM protein n=1 Tax=unclassified Duganella TaxID=2636909 RepID=UPI000E340F01|nr:MULTISPECIES: choice-of-anchor C family protein [unclassified Duganella]RFP18348.1 choice-of-anchor C family protein [Duganella sp. BJB475]RFP35013.1 choice-of-anchor C family protein [Duganella sp. BJB476]
MLKIKKLAAIAALVALAPLAHASSPELIANGGFESAANAFSGNFITLGSGLDGWVINSGSVDLINNYWQPASGSYSLDLNGSGTGTISQSFATTVGATYNVSFSMAGNHDGGGDKTITVGVTDPHSFSFALAGSSHAAMGWQTEGFSFVATSTQSTLTFAGNDANSYYGAALDNVSVTAAVPEPETYAMLLAGLGLVGAIARRRRPA